MSDAIRGSDTLARGNEGVTSKSGSGLLQFFTRKCESYANSVIRADSSAPFEVLPLNICYILLINYRSDVQKDWVLSSKFPQPELLDPVPGPSPSGDICRVSSAASIGARSLKAAIIDLAHPHAPPLSPEEHLEPKSPCSPRTFNRNISMILLEGTPALFS